MKPIKDRFITPEHVSSMLTALNEVINEVDKKDLMFVFDEVDNPTEKMMAGKFTFRLKVL